MECLGGGSAVAWSMLDTADTTSRLSEEGAHDRLITQLRREDEELRAEVARARAAYVEALPTDGKWIKYAGHRARLDKVEPPLGYTALSFAREELDDERKIEHNSVEGTLRLRVSGRRIKK